MQIVTALTARPLAVREYTGLRPYVAIVARVERAHIAHVMYMNLEAAGSEEAWDRAARRIQGRGLELVAVVNPDGQLDRYEAEEPAPVHA